MRVLCLFLSLGCWLYTTHGWGRGCPRLASLWMNTVRGSFEDGITDARVLAFHQGGLTLLKNVGGTYDTGLGSQAKTLFFLAQLIRQLPPATHQGAVLSILSVREGDGKEALRKRLNVSAVRRIFESFVGIAYAWNQDASPEHQIDLSQLHTFEGTRQALQTMGIYTLTDAELDIFSQEGLPLLQQVGGPENGFASQTRQFFSEVFRRQLPRFFQSQLRPEIFLVRDHDGLDANRTTRKNISALFRIYLTWVEILKRWNQTHPDELIPIAQTHTQKGMQAALKTMGIFVLTPSQITTYIALVLPLMREVKRYYSAGWTTRTRSNFFDTLIVEFFPEDIQEEALDAIVFVKDDDGREASRDHYNGASVLRIYLAWIELFKLWNRYFELRDEDRWVDLGELHTRSGMLEALYQLGIDLP